MYARATGATDKELVSRSWAPEELAWGTGEALCPAAAYKKTRTERIADALGMEPEALVRKANGSHSE